MLHFKKYSATLFCCFLTIYCCSAQNHSSISFLALGDSYTIGERVAEKDRWPVQLVDSLRKQGLKVKDPYIIAETGWTTDELANAIKNEDPPKDFDLVSLLIGVNNQYRGYEIETYKNEFEQLLKQAVTFAGGVKSRVFVISIPDYGVTPFGQEKNPNKISLELERYNKIARTISQKHQIPFINITPLSKEASKDSLLIAADGLHPSGKMYQQWVSKIIPVILPVLQ